MTENIVMVLVFCVLFGGVARVSVALWKNYRDPWAALRRVEMAASSGMTTADPHLGRARVRSQLAVMIGAWSLPLFLVPQVVDVITTWGWTAASRSPFFDRAPNFVEFFAIFLAGVGIALYLSIVYLNFPKVLSPREMRNDPGLLTIRRLLSRGKDVDGVYDDSARRS